MLLYGRPFVYVNDFFLDPEAQTLQSYTLTIGQFQQDVCLWAINQDPTDSKEPTLYAPGIQVLVKVWKDGCPWEISDTYSELQMSATLMNTPIIKLLGIRFLRRALKSQHSLAGVELQNGQEIDLLIPEQGGT